MVDESCDAEPSQSMLSLSTPPRKANAKQCGPKLACTPFPADRATTNRRLTKGTRIILFEKVA